MKKLLRYLAFAVLGLAVVVLAVVGIVAATFNPNDYKPLIIKLVQEKKQRTLTLEGDIKLSFWPNIGADLGKVALSEHNKPEEFASIQRARVSLALIPLLSKQLVVDTVYVDGVNAHIVRYKDGSTNFDDLLSKDDEPSEQIKFDIDGVHISNTRLQLDDQTTGGRYTIDQFQLKAGHVALKTPFDLETSFIATANQPSVKADIRLKGNFMADPEAKHFVAKHLDATVKGDLVTLKQAEIQLSGDIDAKPDTMELLVDSLKLALAGSLEGARIKAELAAPKLLVEKDAVSGKEAKLSFSQEKGSDTLQAKLMLADIKGSPAAIQSSGISGEFSAKQAARAVSGQFSSPLAGNLQKQIFDLPNLVGKITIKDAALPKGEMQGDFVLKLHADVLQEKLATDFSLGIAETHLKGNLAVNSFKQSALQFHVDADQLNLNQLLGAPVKSEAKQESGSKPGAPADLSALGKLLLQGNLSIGKIIYDKYQLSGLSLGIKADGKTLEVRPLKLKLDDSSIQGSVGISRFKQPLYQFDLDIDKLDADRYISQDKSAGTTKADPNAPIDLSVLKQFNAQGELRIGWLKVANIKSSNVRIKLEAEDGVAQLSPFSANLYEGSMSGALKVDARSVPSISVKQNMAGIAIGPLLTDAINNDMLAGKGSLNLDINTQGGTVAALKKGLNGTAALNLADGAVKGIDIAGTLRGIKDKLNVLKSESKVAGDKSKKTDFSEMLASFTIKNGVAHNEDLSMKAPLFRITGSGDIDIANETLNYTAKPTVVASLKGQGGAGLDELNGITIPVKLTGTFSKPDYGIDFAAMASAIAQKKLLDKVGGGKADALKGLVGGNKQDALNSLLGGKKTQTAPAPAATEQKPESAEDKTKKKLNKLLGF